MRISEVNMLKSFTALSVDEHAVLIRIVLAIFSNIIMALRKVLVLFLILSIKESDKNKW